MLTTSSTARSASSAATAGKAIAAPTELPEGPHCSGGGAAPRRLDRSALPVNATARLPLWRPPDLRPTGGRYASGYSAVTQVTQSAQSPTFMHRNVGV
jgi:hypothetical protein